MRSTQQFSVTLPNEMAQMVKKKVASGEYASESEVIREGLRALQARETALERWLQTEAVAAYDAAMKDPSRVVSGAEARAIMKAFRERMSKERR
ncbi:type II toxin-antitoxin system ParD family antitoxin [Labrys okinawensis]|uniref:type II toxin-antitoxin system ParD family antitoxin n=1 Tax=Labrys okinawensis TaxID=346911 RepID=UPI0039BCEA85